MDFWKKYFYFLQKKEKKISSSLIHIETNDWLDGSFFVHVHFLKMLGLVVRWWISVHFKCILLLYWNGWLDGGFVIILVTITIRNNESFTISIMTLLSEVITRGDYDPLICQSCYVSSTIIYILNYFWKIAMKCRVKCIDNF